MVATPPDAISASALFQLLFAGIVTVGLGYIVKTLPGVRDTARDVKTVLVGLDGKGGLQKQVADIDDRTCSIENWKIRLEALAEAEASLGPEKRERHRRQSDALLAEGASLVGGSKQEKKHG